MTKPFVGFSSLFVILWTALLPGSLRAQPVVPADSTSEVLAPAGLPIFLTLGLAYGKRTDDCTLCESPLDNKSFSAHLSLGKRLPKGLGVGLDASVWKRGRPGTPGPADSTGAATPTSLSNMLGNASVSLSYQIWHAWVRGGTGIAWGHQDQEEPGEEESPVVVRASGKGVGYSFGGGLKLPLHPMIALAVYGNWNAGTYDLTSIRGVIERDTQHRFWEIGIGITLR